MATQTARGPASRQPYVETESEASDVFTDSDEENSEEDDDDEEEDEAPVPMSTPANVGTKRSDPSIAQKKNKYATSDSGYSSLTATTASSSQSKRAAAQPSATEKLKQKLVETLKMSKPATQTRPLASRRQSQRLERTTRDLRSVESREDAARMSLTGASTRASAGRRPSMPGDYPPSPTRTTHIPAPIAAAPRPVPRPRASTTTQQTGGQRPQTYHAGSAPGNGMVYQLAPVQQGQHFVIAQQQPYYQHVPQQTAQPLQVNTAAYHSGSWGSQHGYMPTPTSATTAPAYPSNYSYPYNQNPQAMQHPMHAQPQPQPQPQHQNYHWPSSSGSYNGGYSGALGDFHDQYSRRMSITNSGMPYQHNPGAYYPDAHPPHYPQLRRMSQTVQPNGTMFQPPPPRTPVDEGVFFEDDDDPDNFYRGFHHAVDRVSMPPPPRPQSSHRPRPPMVHARTTSAAHAAHRLSRGSIEYRDYADVSPRKASFEGRPPSRPGLPQRISSGSSRALVHAQTEPQSPLRTRHRKGSTYGYGELEPIVQAAEAYQERTGGYGSNFATDDLPPLSKRPTKTSDTGSRGSRGSGSRENGEKKRLNRHSLDKSKLREGSDPGVQLSIGTVRLDVKGGTTMTIKHSQEGMKALPAPPPVSRPPSTKPTREASRARAERPETKRYISATNSTRSSNKERAEVEVARKRRSSSVQPRIGRDEGGRDLADSIARLRLENDSRQSRRSSRSGRATADR